MMNDRRNIPTWQWIVGVLLMLLSAAGTTLGGIAAYAYVDTQAKIKELDQTKAEVREVIEMKQDIRDIKAMMTSHIIESGNGRVTARRRQ